MSNILATLQNHCSHPGTKLIFRGKDGKKLKVDYYVDDSIPVGLRPPVLERLKEAKQDGTVIYAKPGETTKTSAELVKEGKPVSKPQKEKPVDPEIKPEQDQEAKK
jgi:hypothetical protein